MSTQDAQGITFSVSPEESREQFRLLELPPELLELITTNPSAKLHFKSTDGIPGQSPDPHAVLCTPNKTYNIRQVNTSNSLYITQPTKATPSPDDPGAPQHGIEAIAQSGFTLELTADTTTSAAPYLRAALPTYTSSGHSQHIDHPITKTKLFDDIPLSTAECESAWRDLACFEISDRGCLLPSAKTQSQAWRSIYSAATAAGIDLTSPLSPTDVVSIIDRDEDWPVELSRAMLDSVSSPSSEDETSLVDADKCVRRVGINELASSSGSMSIATLKTQWADILPETWRNKVDLTLLGSSCRVEGQTVRYVDESSLASKSGAGGDAKPLGAKRKWHEKFRASNKKTA